MKTTRELREKRAGLIREARQILDKAEAETREPTAEEQERWDKAMDDVARLGEQIEREERMRTVEGELGESARAPHKPEPDGQAEGDGRAVRPEDRGRPGESSLVGRASTEYRKAYASWLRGGLQGLTGQEVRALQADNDTLGGYLVTPVAFVNALLKAVDDLVYIRQWATVYPVGNAESLGVPSLDSDPADATWTTELATGSEDSSMGFGRRELHPHPLAKRIKISRKLLMKVPDVETLVRDRLAYKFGITQEKAFLTGSGAQQPLGIFTASNDGIPTSRDVSTGNTTTELRFDGLIEAKFTLKPQYWPRARWLFHRDGVKQIARLKDGDGQYIWRESVRVGEPDRVLGLPVFMSEYAPNTFTASQYVGMVGDFSNYWIADALSMEVQRLVELYAETNQVGLIGRLECDGMPVLAEAFVRVKLAAS